VLLSGDPWSFGSPDPAATGPAVLLRMASAGMAPTSGESALPLAAAAGRPHGRMPSGVIHKAPRFYEHYTGPKLAGLNAVGASGELAPSGTFTFRGTNQGRIGPVPAVYAFGIDRGGATHPGPFPDRPGVTFDAVVVVTLGASSAAPSARVVDLANRTETPLPSGSARVHGRQVEVVVPASLLPSTGSDPAHYRYNYWPEDGRSTAPEDVASFAPEFTTAPVGSSGRHGG
jgi:hypothetical protein